ncbi:MAG TPA: ATP phosphoribosyltransferase regulatory subunit [Dehalococcoidia bacterium]|nr:ATP phosphoribosyltransferase regulatory subunit [Dehalococcoidia bacterium]
MKIERCRGSFDMLPEEMRRFRHIEQIFRDSCLGWGYEEVRTPTLEYLHLFTAAGTLTPERLGRVYSFLDWDGWSGERVVLRPDGTIPAARLFVEHLAGQGLAKLFYVQNVFCFEETGRERRERWQCGAELIGSPEPAADVELISLAREVLGKLKLGQPSLRLAHAGVIRELLSCAGLADAEQAEVFDQMLDGRLDALGEVEKRYHGMMSFLPLFLESKGDSPGFVDNLKASLPQGMTGLRSQLDNLLQVVERLGALDCQYEVDLASGRGFEYYTGVMFQLYLGDSRVGGGGRYDGLIPLVGGVATPASGFALYVDELIRLLPGSLVEPPPWRRVSIKAQTEGVGGFRQCFDLAGRLRAAGYTVELDLGSPRGNPPRWLVEVGEAGLRLIDRARGEEFGVEDLAQLVHQLEAECQS